MKLLSSLTVDELADGICLRAGRVAAGQAELLTWVAEFDRREGWGGPGMLSCAHWLSWRIGLSLGAAREQVRVARRLQELPGLAVAFGDGRLSYSKVRAITRVAEPADGVDWVDLARHSSAAQLEQVVRGVRRAQAADQAPADPELTQWKVRTRKRYDRDGNLVITITTRAEYAPVVEAGLAAKRAELQRELDAQDAGDVSQGPPAPAEPTESAAPPDVPAGTPDRPTVSHGDALLALAQDALAAEKAAHPDIARRRRPQLTARIDPLSGWGRQADGELLPPTSLQAVLKTLPGRGGLVRLRPVTDADLRRLDLGRSQRTSWSAHTTTPSSTPKASSSPCTPTAGSPSPPPTASPCCTTPPNPGATQPPSPPAEADTSPQQRSRPTSAPPGWTWATSSQWS